jgi:hypothetical protein
MRAQTAPIRCLSIAPASRVKSQNSLSIARPSRPQSLAIAANGGRTGRSSTPLTGHQVEINQTSLCTKVMRKSDFAILRISELFERFINFSYSNQLSAKPRNILVKRLKNPILMGCTIGKTRIPAIINVSLFTKTPRSPK